MRLGEGPEAWRIIKFPWSEAPHYVLWHGGAYVGTFSSLDDAQKKASGDNSTLA